MVKKTFEGPDFFQNVYEVECLCLKQCLCNDKDHFIKRGPQRTKLFKTKQDMTSSIQRFRFVVKSQHKLFFGFIRDLLMNGIFQILHSTLTCILISSSVFSFCFFFTFLFLFLFHSYALLLPIFIFDLLFLSDSHFVSLLFYLQFIFKKIKEFKPSFSYLSFFFFPFFASHP